MAVVEELYTLAGAAAAAQVIRPTLLAAVRRGEIPVRQTKDGKCTLVHLEDVLEWKAQERRPGPKPKNRKA